REKERGRDHKCAPPVEPERNRSGDREHDIRTEVTQAGKRSRKRRPIAEGQHGGEQNARRREHRVEPGGNRQRFARPQPPSRSGRKPISQTLPRCARLPSCSASCFGSSVSTARFLRRIPET